MARSAENFEFLDFQLLKISKTNSQALRSPFIAPSQSAKTVFLCTFGVPFIAPSQWAKRVFWQTLGHNLGKKSGTDIVEGSFPAHKDKHKKRQSEFWSLIGDWGQVPNVKFGKIRRKKHFICTFARFLAKSCRKKAFANGRTTPKSVVLQGRSIYHFFQKCQRKFDILSNW